MKRLALLTLLILPLLCAPALADYGCWPFGGVDQLIFPSCVAAGGHRSMDVNVVSGVAPAPVGTQQVDLVKVGGVAFAQGQRALASSLSVGPATESMGVANANAAAPIAAQMIVSDNTNLQRVLAPIILGDGVNGNNMISDGVWGWNGASWDRVPVTAAHGVQVDLVNTQANGTPINVLLAAGSAVIGHVITDVGSVFKTDQTTPGTTDLVHAKVCDGTTSTQCASVSAGGVLSVSTPVPLQTTASGAVAVNRLPVDAPCASTNLSTFPFNLSATDTTAVTHSGSTLIYICSFTINNTVATGNTRLRYGTTTTTPCDTGGVNLYNSGLAVDGANYPNAGYQQFKAVPANNDLCITFTGTGGVAAGSITYIQQ